MARTIKESVNFLLENIDSIEENDLCDAIEKVTSKKIGEAISYYSYDSIFFGKYLFDFQESIQWNLSRFNLWLQKNYEGNKNLFLAYAKNSSLFFSYYLRMQGENFTISQIEYSASNLFYFLRYVILGAFDNDDYTIANEMAKIFKANGNSSNFAIKISEGNHQHISVKAYKNGRLDIKGLNPGQLLYIKTMIEKKRKAHINPDYKGNWDFSN